MLVLALYCTVTVSGLEYSPRSTLEDVPASTHLDWVFDVKELNL
jgi:hypothetical protein